DDIAAVDSNPYIIYVGFATGGIWKTVNNGTTWEPIFDKYSVSSIGDIAINQSNPEIVWVGTGEANNRQSSTIGDGVYKSTDGGAGSALWKTVDAAKTWTKVEGNGFPSGGGVLGRMGIDVSRSNPNVLMTIMEVGNSPGTGGGVGPNGEEQAAGGGGGGGRQN